jgi:hypothetical protein
MPSYLGKIRKARSIPQIALYIRAQGCFLATMLQQTYTSQAAIQTVVDYENKAQAIERCETTEQALRLRSGWGF